MKEKKFEIQGSLRRCRTFSDFRPANILREPLLSVFNLWNLIYFCFSFSMYVEFHSGGYRNLRTLLGTVCFFNVQGEKRSVLTSFDNCSMRNETKRGAGRSGFYTRDGYKTVVTLPLPSKEMKREREARRTFIYRYFSQI